jgi:plastocyanin
LRARYLLGTLEGRGTQAATAFVVALALATLAGCGGDGGPANATVAPKVTILVERDAYRPSSVRIPVGGRVTFVGSSETANTAETGGVDTLEGDRERLDRQNRFDVHTLQNGEAETVEFDTPGRYDFHSSFNEEMKGVVEVVAAPE